MRIDMHNHVFPKAYVARLATVGKGYAVTHDSEGDTIVTKDGARFLTITPPMADPDARLADMDRAGVDIQALSLSAPSVYFADPEDSLELAQLINDEEAAMCRRHPDRFVGLATVPLNHPDYALQELDRALGDLDMRGIILGSNIDGKRLDDEHFRPFFEEANRRKLLIFIHPMTPPSVEATSAYTLTPLVGFLFDTTLAAARLVFSGMCDELPDIRWVLGHLGGAVPYLWERLDSGYRAYPACRERISKPPSAYLRHFYYDTVSFHAPSLICAHQTVGAERMVLGSDYPHVIGDLPGAVTSVEGLSLAESEKAKILSGNARMLLGL
jgi:aminocarboxymuconate-semialdehyde decarboxylase